MIARYSRSDMAWVWDDRNKYRIWLEVELAVCEEMANLGLIPSKDWSLLQKKAAALKKAGGIDPKKIEAHEAVTKHDVIAFTTAVAEELGPLSRYIHFGLTSSDVVDTALSIQIQRAGSLLKKELEALLKVLKVLALKYQGTPTIGRSHGIFAEPTSFGLKFLGWYCEWERNQERLATAIEQMRYGKLSGAVGVNPHWGPEFEEKVLAQLGLKRERMSTQIIPRDRHAEFMGVLAVLGSSLERIALELRHLQRSEVGEVSEGFRKGQKGSSAMPHKKNPISSENLTGCARLLRSYAQAAFEDVALWHERDISHSSVERVIFPDATLILDYALNRMSETLQNLDVHVEKIHKNLASASQTSYSGHFLLELVKTGVTREEAYAWVQACALKALEGGERSFIDLLKKHPEIHQRLSDKKIDELGSLKYQLRNVDLIYQKALRQNSNAKK